MQLRKLTLLFAAALLLGMTQPAKAVDAPTSVVDTIADYEDQLEDTIAGTVDDDDDDADDDNAFDRRRRGPRDFRDRRPGPHHGPMAGHYGFRGMDGPRGRMDGFRKEGFRRPGMDHAAKMFGPRAWEKLNLTAEQRTKIIDLMTNNYRAKLEASLEMLEARRSLRGLYQEDNNLQAESIIAAHSAMGAARGRMVALDRQLKTDLKGVLTPEQQKTWDDMQKPPFRKPGPDGKNKDGKGPGDRRPQRGPDGPGPRR